MPMSSVGLALVAAGYLLGSVPFALLVSRAFGGPDPRSAGSGNLGATNVARLAGKPAGVATLLLDAAKGSAPVYAGLAWASPPEAALAGMAAFLGHCYPLYLGFRGGKGVATAMGVYLALAPLALAGAVAVFALAVWRTGHVSVGSIGACLSAPVWMLLAGRPGALPAVAVLMAALVVWRHRENITRLRAGKEHGWR
jgi:glycerol-3-phosphate acyltransferase PlsY